MGEEVNQNVAQLQHKYNKLLAEMDLLREHTLSMEETLNIKCSELLAEKKQIKSLEQQNDSLCQILKEKEHLIDSLEQDISNFKQVNNKLSTQNSLLKQELCKERLKNEQLEKFKVAGEELKNAFTKIKEENQRLTSELSLKTEECFLNDATINDLTLQVKELTNEKTELQVMCDILRQEKQDRFMSLENLEFFHRKSSKSLLDLQDVDSASCNREMISSNLREEMLEVELQEKQNLIVQLKNLLQEREEIELGWHNSIVGLKAALSNAGLLDCNLKMDLRLESSAFCNIYNHLLRLINWPEGQSTECKPLTDAPAISVIVKDGVQTTQPGSARTVETMSIASQTDPLKNLSPVLPLRSIEKLQSNHSLTQSRSDSDEEGEDPLAFVEKERVEKGFQLFSEPKNCDLDMDIYRSCRKLSVLPEEDIDESSNRKSSFKKPPSDNMNSFNLKTHSADDITKIPTIRPLLKATSCSNVTPKSRKQANGFELIPEIHGLCDATFGSTTSQNLNRADKENNGELRFSITSPKEAYRQPHSFDSYLDPLITRNPPLPRQTSDPTQNTVFAPSVTRRGSYIRRPRSTCRPLTLPCNESDKKKEERICKVRFDLGGIGTKNEESVIEKELKSSPVLCNAKKIKMVSRFTVEVIDEDEFRKSLEENERNPAVTRKRPPLIHSVVYKKSALRDLTNFGDKNDMNGGSITPEMNNIESPDSPVYDTATENSPVDSFDGSENYMNDSYPVKRRKQSDASCYSFEDSQSSSEGNDILIKSIKLHTNSKCIIMKDLKKENSDSSCSNADSEIPYIDAEDLPVIKANPEIIKISPVPEILFSEKPPPTVALLSPGSPSEGSDKYLTPCDVTPVTENSDTFAFAPTKSSGLSKSPTVLKNLANFELLVAISETRKLSQSEIIEEEKEGECEDKNVEDGEGKKSMYELKSGSDVLKRTSSDVSEASESDTLTYGTVKSHMAGSSDYDSDTYVTVLSDKSFTFERKFSDLSENSSSPYNTPPDTSSASFCTPPDTYSPILSSVKKYSSVDKSRRSSDSSFGEKRREDVPDNFCGAFDVSSPSPPVLHQNRFGNSTCFSRLQTEHLNPTKQKTNESYNVIFDSPKLEFYETNDSVENLEAFLQTEEGLREDEAKAEVFKFGQEGPDELENLPDSMFFETEDFREALSKRNSLESPKPLERRKKHPPLSRQNSTEEYNFLDPHDSCLNLSEEMSSPSTTPDTSNKTVIFKNVPLTVSNTIDLDDDFPISETEVQINFNGSQTEILDVSQREESTVRYTKDGHCLSEPCTPSISSADFLEFSVPRKQRSSFTEESLMCGKFESNLPEIIVSRLSSESENSDSEVAGCAETDFASNVSDRSEIHLSDVNSLSGHSDNCGSLSEHSDNVVSDVFSSDSDKSSGISPEITHNSSSPASEKTSPIQGGRGQEEMSMDCESGFSVACDIRTSSEVVGNFGSTVEDGGGHEKILTHNESVSSRVSCDFGTSSEVLMGVREPAIQDRCRQEERPADSECGSSVVRYDFGTSAFVACCDSDSISSELLPGVRGPLIQNGHRQEELPTDNESVSSGVFCDFDSSSDLPGFQGPCILDGRGEEVLSMGNAEGVFCDFNIEEGLIRDRVPRIQEGRLSDNESDSESLSTAIVANIFGSTSQTGSESDNESESSVVRCGLSTRVPCSEGVRNTFEEECGQEEEVTDSDGESVESRRDFSTSSMSKRSDSPVSARYSGSSLDLSDGSSTSDMDSDNSRDVNLNSKKFTDCNLLRFEVEKNNNSNSRNDAHNDEFNFTSAIEELSTKYSLRSGDSERTQVLDENSDLDLRNKSELENSNHLVDTKKTLLTTSSTPKPESADPQSFYNLFTISTETSPVEPGNKGQTFLVEKTALNQSASLSNEEVGKKFQDLSFAFKTDSMTIQKRLQLMKRRRDQAEANIENELSTIKGKLKNLQYTGLNSECVNLMTDLKKQLDFVFNATLHLSSSAESYGYAQHEERLLELIAVMLQHVENVESSKADLTKASDKLKTESQKSPTSMFLDSVRDDDKILRRRSVAAVALQGNCRRRASIATLPNSIENGSNGKGSQWITPNRSSGGAAKKLSFSQTSPRSNFSSLPGTDDLRESINARHRKESRTSDSMTNIDEVPEQRSSVELELIKEPVDSDSNTEVNDSSLHLKQLFESIEEVRRNSSSQEHITAAQCLRRIIEWNKLLLSSARFRWPENVLDYAPFYITWYIVFVLTLVFIGGLFTGINGCYTYSCLKYFALWLAAPAFCSFTGRYYRLLLLLFFTLVFALVLLFFWVTKILLPQLSSEEVDSLFAAFGLEIQYLNGPPPV